MRTTFCHHSPSKLFVSGQYLRNVNVEGLTEVGTLSPAQQAAPGKALPFPFAQFLRYLHRGLGTQPSKPKVRRAL